MLLYIVCTHIYKNHIDEEEHVTSVCQKSYKETIFTLQFNCHGYKQ